MSQYRQLLTVQLLAGGAHWLVSVIVKPAAQAEQLVMELHSVHEAAQALQVPVASLANIPLGQDGTHKALSRR